tara:strand:+ start:4921 stop:5373 length:453 start_codon:yes stop_codon:yes gene_type:complete
MSEITTVKEDILEEDMVQIPSQKFALLSVVSPQSSQKHTSYGIKIRGVFATREEAAFHVKRLQKLDSTFDIYLVDMYKWLLIPPDNSQIDDNEYQEDMLTEIIKGHKEQQYLAKEFHKQRIQDDIERNMTSHDPNLEVIQDYTTESNIIS